MIYESAINHFELEELPTFNGIQAVINKLNLIKHKPTQHQKSAVKLFAMKLASLEQVVPEANTQMYIRLDEVTGLWRARRDYKGKRFSFKSKHYETVERAYLKFCEENWIVI